jgi:hypothetical protein
MFCERCSDDFYLVKVAMPEVTTKPVAEPSGTRRLVVAPEPVPAAVGFCLP